MKREIKFRAWNKVDRGWIIADIFDIGKYDSLTLDPEKICQFTGLKDSVGAEIYEGDIMKSSKRKKFLVIFSDYKHGWAVKALFRIPGRHDRTIYKSIKWAVDNCEIIDNIHESFNDENTNII